MAEDRREDREATLRERASAIDADAHDNYCGTTCPPDDSHDAPLFIKRVLDALREGNAYPHWCRDGHDRIGFSGDNEMCPACLARAEGERAGREAEREACAHKLKEQADYYVGKSGGGTWSAS